MAAGAVVLLLSGCNDTKVESTDLPEVSAEPHYSNCEAAREAGVAPLKSGDPGYRLALDRNRDGVACE